MIIVIIELTKIVDHEVIQQYWDHLSGGSARYARNVIRIIRNNTKRSAAGIPGHKEYEGLLSKERQRIRGFPHSVPEDRKHLASLAARLSGNIDFTDSDTTDDESSSDTESEVADVDMLDEWCMLSKDKFPVGKDLQPQTNLGVDDTDEL